MNLEPRTVLPRLVAHLRRDGGVSLARRAIVRLVKPIVRLQARLSARVQAKLGARRARWKADRIRRRIDGIRERLTGLERDLVEARFAQGNYLEAVERYRAESAALHQELRELAGDQMADIIIKEHRDMIWEHTL